MVTNIENDSSFSNSNYTIITKNTPKSIFNMFTTITRSTKPITIKYKPRTAKFQKFYLNSGLTIYNNIPNEIKNKSIPIFKKLTKKWLVNQTIPIDSND